MQVSGLAGGKYRGGGLIAEGKDNLISDDLPLSRPSPFKGGDRWGMGGSGAGDAHPHPDPHCH